MHLDVSAKLCKRISHNSGVQLEINSLDHTSAGSSQYAYQYDHVSSVSHRAGKGKLNQHKPSFLQSQYNYMYIHRLLNLTLTYIQLFVSVDRVKKTN